MAERCGEEPRGDVHGEVETDEVDERVPLRQGNLAPRLGTPEPRDRNDQFLVHVAFRTDALSFVAASRPVRTTASMSHHLFLLSPSDTPLYELTHFSSKPVQTTASPLASNLPSWSTSAFAGTLTALSGASSAVQSYQVQGGGVRMGGGKDRHVIQMIANASLDVIEDVMRKDVLMWASRDNWDPSTFSLSSQVSEIRRQIQRMDYICVCDPWK